MPIPRLEPMVGDTVKVAVRRLLFMVRMAGRSVSLDFNDVVVVARPGDKPDPLVTRIIGELKERGNSLEYIGEEEEEEEPEED